MYQIGNSLTKDTFPYSLLSLAAENGIYLYNGVHIRSSQSATYIQANPTDFTEASAANSYLNTSASNVGDIWTLALPSRPWTDVVIEPYPAGGVTIGSEIAAMQTMFNASQQGSSRLLIYETWPGTAFFGSNYQTYWNGAVVPAGATVMTQQRAAYDYIYQQLLAQYPNRVRVIPVGSVFNRLDIEARNGNIPGIATAADFYRDSLHQGNAGHFVAAMTVYMTKYRAAPASFTNTLPQWQFFVEAGATIDVTRANILMPYILSTVLADPRTSYNGA